MSQLKQNWKVLTLTVLSCAAMVGGWSILNFGALSPMQVGGIPNDVPLSEADRSKIDSVLESIDLQRDSLAALNPTALEATELLSAVRMWWDLHGANWSELSANVARQRNTIRNLEGLARTGAVSDGHEQDLAAARDALAGALHALAQQEDALKTDVAALMSESQRSTWGVIQRGWGRDMPMGMLDLTHEQRQAYSRALRHHKLSLAAATTQDGRETVEADWQATLTTILTPENQQVIADWQEHATDAYASVDAAIGDAFPTTDG